MNSKHLLILLMILMLTISAFGDGEDNVKGTINDADTFFAEGEFEKAEAIYKTINNKDPKNYDAQIGHSRCAILKNHLGCAFRYSNKALELKPDNIEPKYNLAKINYRVGKFDEALPYFKELKNEVMITKLEGFYELKPFEISPEPKIARVKFISMEPVPVIEISINGNKKEKFIIDTGVKETLIDVSYAKEIQAKFLVSETGPFLNYKKITFGHGILESIMLGNLTVKNVPIHVVNFENVKLNKLTDEGIKGILGVSFLSNFIFTIDPINELFIIRYIDSREEYKSFNESIEKSNPRTAPFYLTLENEIISKVSLNNKDPKLFKISCGLPEYGVITSKNIASNCGIKPIKKIIVGTDKVLEYPFISSTFSVTLNNAAAYTLNTKVLYKNPFEGNYDFEVGGTIGYEFFKKYTTTFDFIGMRIIMAKPFKEQD